MKVSKLIEYLQKVGDVEVIIAKDTEGNGFSPLADHSQEHYFAETDYSGEVVDSADGDSVPVVVLWPTK